jgi:hypothetical protein
VHHRERESNADVTVFRGEFSGCVYGKAFENVLGKDLARTFSHPFDFQT